MNSTMLKMVLGNAPGDFSNYHVGLSPPALVYGLQPAPAPVPAPLPPPTPAPVAPVAATTEFSLPEIIENRSVKFQGSSQGHGNFIPLNQLYGPPSVGEQPSYESPKPSDGYYYAPPSTAGTSTTTPQPIIVQDPGEYNDVEQNPPGYDYHAPAPVAPQRPSTPAPVYLPPGEILPEQTQQVRLRLKDMRCLPGAYFRAVLKLDSFLGAAPIMDNDHDEDDDHCELKLSRSFLLLDIPGADFERCGVKSCGQDLCLRLRFPTIRGLRTAGDSILTLHCKSQERVAVKTHALKMGVSNDVQARSVGNYAHGGNQNAFRTHVELLRRGTNGYTRHLESNGAVQLGEELLLRAHVLAGDGWNYTKLSDVQLQRISPSGEILNNAQLISSRGCLNPAMQSICSHAPIFEPPLGQRLHFKAVMFPGMRSGDILVMSMRMTGCLEREDCQVKAQDCLAQRRRRNASNGTEISELSHLTFRVIMPNRALVTTAEDDLTSVVLENPEIIETSKTLALIGSLGFIVLLLGVAIVALYKFGK
ncbi:uncharacterized protein Dwil_GK17924 [Drosophila willistoni]|uniref:ZP domain-containing protein n=1 Tax=Drosophila willistoni TaxID=7260 RepID=B4N5R2_DROWI|nr:uncharacterized protein LOC6646275 [Drosophila willistoni]EDW79701.1 uncharacterized protein Dwil_GK17924 [Drosophila willistoni]